MIFLWDMEKEGRGHCYLNYINLFWLNRIYYILYIYIYIYIYI
jgi:hypothetical protein